MPVSPGASPRGLEFNKWHEIRWSLGPQGMVVRLNDEVVFSETVPYPSLTRKRIQIASTDSTVDVEYFDVKQER